MLFLAALPIDRSKPPIDREALVTRHNVTLTTFDPNRRLQVGNGRFAFGMDITGLQTFAPFNTMSDWVWNSLPLPEGAKISDFQGQVWMTHGRPIRYPMPDPEHPAISDWLAGNPHRINLGRLGFHFYKSDGTEGGIGDIQNPRQTLDLWRGLVTSKFEFEGTPVTVVTGCHPGQDTVAVKVVSPLVGAKRIAVFFDCPEDDGAQFANYVGHQAKSAVPQMSHRTDPNDLALFRTLNDSGYDVRVHWDGAAKVQPPSPSTSKVEIENASYGSSVHRIDVTEAVRKKVVGSSLAFRVGNDLGGDPAIGQSKTLSLAYRFRGKHETLDIPENGEVALDLDPDSHRFLIRPSGSEDTFGLTCHFHPASSSDHFENSPNKVLAHAASHWPNYWRQGGVIDLSGSRDPRSKELERRIVLSQYLMAVNEAGLWPPQESGLVNNGWFGRFHLEMYWWHTAHWALWNRWPMLERSLDFYKRILPAAKAQARSEGYLGARWPKCIAPDDREWPHIIHSLLIWQQPHPLFFAELDYRAHPTRETLLKWQPVVEATADFLASYAFLDPARGRYVLGPPMVVVSENTDPKTTQNPTFELGYWRFGLRIASEWRKRLGLAPNAKWQEVEKGLSPLPEQDGVYVLHEGIEDMWTRWNFEHPALTGVYGMLPGDGVDPAVMESTLQKVTKAWNFDHVWGWDFPMLAMCAARLGHPEQAIDFLLHPSPNFQFDEYGLATGGPFPYFPSNGGLLYAVAMMAAGWDGSKTHAAPGFPNDGSWNVRSEGLSAAP